MHAVHIQRPSTHHRPSTHRLLAAGIAASIGVTLLAAPASAASATVTEGTAPRGTAGREAVQATTTATRTGQRVEVVSARTELTQVFAKPGGGFVAETAAVPQRIRQGDGSWSDVDLSLRRDATGLRPAVSPANVLFSAGGRGPAATLTTGKSTMTLGWPGGLPAPTVSADAATYPEVLPGVDLVLTATHTGFTHVLVVKTPQAATNPALREIRFDLGGDARVRREADGSLRALAGGAEVARAATAEMWDSTGSVGAPRAAAASSPSGPGVAARTAPVSTAVDEAGDLVLRPSAGLLDPAKATFPVYIDPAWSASPSRWAYATSNNSTNSDTTAARVGKDADSGVTYRSYFEFPISALSGKIIRSAYVQVVATHTWSCFDTPTYLYQSGAITSTPRTAWAPALTTLRASASSHVRATGCIDSPQPPMNVRFAGSVAAGLSSAAAAHQTSITYGLCACSDSSGTGESTVDRWKKFDPSTARLVVDYDTAPSQPTALQAGGAACVTGGRVTLGTAPTLSAVFPDADAGQVLQTAYELLEIPASGTYDSTTPRMTAPTGSTVTAGARSTTAAVTGTANGKSYAFRTRSDDGYLLSPWSAWCEFSIDNQPPTVSVDAVTSPAPPGQLYTYKLRSPDLDVVSFRYGWSSPPTEEAEAGTSLGWTGKTVSVTLATPAYGTNTLYVAAVDSVGNVGYGSLVIQVPTP
ncbi:hypothetical protein ACFYPH_14145 [Micromonospora sp. NPDC005252]|uniref:hypothetical protein n=1 Tax=unclassified Micromonospora TaxID=2617518 RepID=UPI0033B66986